MSDDTARLRAEVDRLRAAMALAVGHLNDITDDDYDGHNGGCMGEANCSLCFALEALHDTGEEG